MTQRPDLFGAALPAVGVMDMLRFHKFTIGWAWKSDYGSTETKEGFDTLIAYSPLHEPQAGHEVSGDAGDDRRITTIASCRRTASSSRRRCRRRRPAPAPVLIRIETKAGHGAGKPTSKQIDERADVLAFLVKVLRMTSDE